MWGCASSQCGSCCAWEAVHNDRAVAGAEAAIGSGLTMVSWLHGAAYALFPVRWADSAGFSFC